MFDGVTTPIILSSLTPSDYHKNQFEKIAQALKGYTNHCVFSFVDFYGKTQTNFKKISSNSELTFENPHIETQRELAWSLMEIPRENQMTLNSCCNDDLASGGNSTQSLY